MTILIRNIKGLVQARRNFSGKVSGKEMQNLPVMENAWLLISDGKIRDFGEMKDVPDFQVARVIDAEGRFVFPSYIDSHTHLVFAGSREQEFVLKIKGATYEEIAAAGGGILNSAKRLGTASEDELYEAALNRINEVILSGTGGIEIKSGYGLSVESELKMLRVIKRLKEASPIPIRSTFLGAHAVPLEYKSDRKSYIRLIIEQMIPKVREEQLADYIDVFCDTGFFTVEETSQILEAGIAHGLKPRIHANELDYSGGIQAGVSHHAKSVDHLEHTGKAEIEALLQSDTMPTLLPSTAFFLRLKYPPAREMIDSGLPVALASDYNPGTSPSGNMNFVVSLACIHLRMSPEEAINAATINSAYSLDWQDSFGSITPGKTANLFITEKIPSYSFLPYSFSTNRIDTVILNGKIYSTKELA